MYTIPPVALASAVELHSPLRVRDENSAPYARSLLCAYTCPMHRNDNRPLPSPMSSAIPARLTPRGALTPMHLCRRGAYAALQLSRDANRYTGVLAPFSSAPFFSRVSLHLILSYELHCDARVLVQRRCNGDENPSVMAIGALLRARFQSRLGFRHPSQSRDYVYVAQLHLVASVERIDQFRLRIDSIYIRIFDIVHALIFFFLSSFILNYIVGRKQFRKA